MLMSLEQAIIITITATTITITMGITSMATRFRWHHPNLAR